MKITELFDRTVDWDWEIRPEYEEGVATINKNHIELTFFINPNKSVDIMFTVNGRMHITGGGSAVAIFGAVVTAVVKWINTHNPKEFAFTAAAKEPSRIALYSKMSTRLASMLPYTLKTTTKGIETEFQFTRQQ